MSAQTPPGYTAFRRAIAVVLLLAAIAVVSAVVVIAPGLWSLFSSWIGQLYAWWRSAM